MGYGKVYQSLTAIIGAFGTLLMGVLAVWPSYTSPQLRAENTTLLNTPMSPAQESLLGSLPSLGAMLGTALVGPVIEAFGRKLGGLAITLPLVLSWTMIGVTKSMTVMLAARFIGGVSGGAHLVFSPIFVSEVAEDSIRGTLASVTILFYASGTLISYLLGWFFAYYTIIWINVTASFVCCILLMSIAESPVYLLKKNREEDAVRSLSIYRGASVNSPVVQKDLSKLKQLMNPSYEMVSLIGKEVAATKRFEPENFIPEPTPKKSVYKTLFTTPSSRRGFLVVFTVISMQVTMGIVPVQVYAKQVFMEADPSQADMYSVIFAVVLVAGNFVTGSIADKAGRRLLIITSSTMVGLCMASLGYLLQTKTSPAWVVVGVILLYCFCFSCGAGTIPYVLLAEVFVPEVQAFASTLIIEWVWFLNFLILAVFTWLISIVGIHGTFYIFAVNSAINVGLSWWLVPETKGMANHEIQLALTKSRWK